MTNTVGTRVRSAVDVARGFLGLRHRIRKGQELVVVAERGEGDNREYRVRAADWSFMDDGYLPARQFEAA